VAKGRVVVSVTTDVCVATGDWTSVEADVRRAAGVKGVMNEIEIKPRDAAAQAPLLEPWG
jgi:hypothetical protein